MASTYYHLMKRSGQTAGKTGDDGDTTRYSYERGDIIAAPKTEFQHLPGGATKAFSSEEKAQEARDAYLEELGK